MDVVEALGATYSLEILGATEEPTSAGELSDSLGIPIATCYRRINQLVSAGLLEECESTDDDARRATVYRRTSDAIGIRFGRTPSVLTWDYVARLKGIETPAAEPTADEVALTPVSDADPGDGESEAGDAANGRTKN
jgi:predicted transcriptional regulator